MAPASDLNMCAAKLVRPSGGHRTRTGAVTWQVMLCCFCGETHDDTLRATADETY